MTTKTKDVDTAVGSDHSSGGVKWEPWFGFVVRLILGGVAGWAGISKLTDLPQSVRAVRAYQLLPDSLVQPVGYALPALEVILAILLITGLLSRYAAIVKAGIMLAFVFGISWAWAQGLNIDCGCFGGGGELPLEQEADYVTPLIRDAGLFLGAVYLAVRPRTRFSLDETFQIV